MGIADEVAASLHLPTGQVAATLRLLADGGTVPFIVRYRKEATGGMDEVVVRAVAEAAEAAEALAARKKAVLKSIPKADAGRSYREHLVEAGLYEVRSMQVFSIAQL